MPVEKLAVQVTKYQNRNGYTQRDVLRLAKPKTAEPARNLIYRWAVGKLAADAAVPLSNTLLDPIFGFEAAKRAKTDKEIVKLIYNYGLVREHIPTEFINSKDVWTAMLECGMPLTAMIRNLGKTSSIGLLAPLSHSAVVTRHRNCYP